MSSESAGPSAPPQISGQLSETPLFVVVRRLQRESLSGTLSVIRGDQVRQLIFENGELCAARSSREDHRIGATLVRWGYISEENLRDALETQRRTLERLDRILVEKGLVTRVVVDSEARRQMEQIVFSTLGWPDGTFHFQADTGAFELDVPISLSQEMIIEGIRRIPESEQFTELLGDLSGIPWLTRDPLSTGSLRLLRDAVEVLSRIDGRVTLRDLLESSAVSGTAGAKILYSLLFAGIIEVRKPGDVPPSAVKPIDPIDRRKEGRRADDRKTGQYIYDMRKAETFRRAAETGVLATAPQPEERAESAPRAPLRSPREVVLELYRQLDWLSHYDLLGVTRKATQAEIEDAYRVRFRLFDPSLKAHPELVDCWRQLTVLAKWLRVAYDVLSKPETRRLYDQKIDAATPPAPAEPGKTD